MDEAATTTSVGHSSNATVPALVDQGVMSATNFITSVIIGRVCSLHEFGLYMLGLSAILFVMTVQTAFLATPFMIYSPRLPENELRGYTGSMVIHHIAICTAILSVLLLGIALIVAGVLAADYRNLLITLAFAMPVILYKDLIRQLCFARFRMMSALRLDVCVSVLQLGSLAALAGLNRLGAATAFAAAGAATIIPAAAWTVHHRREMNVEHRRIVADLKRNWLCGKWIAVSSALWAGCLYAYPWLLTTFHDTAAAGIWAACLATIAIGNPVVLGLQNVLGPKIAAAFLKDDRCGLWRYVVSATARFWLVIAAIAAIFLLFGGELMTLIFGDKYSGNAVTVRILSLNLLTAPIIFTMSRGLFTIERADIECVANVISVVMLLTFSLWAVSQFGPLGAALGLTISNVVAATIRGLAFFTLSYHPRPSRKS